MIFKVPIPKTYKQPILDDICVVMCFFNPINYRKKIDHINYVIQLLQSSSIPIFITELLYPNQTSSLIYKTNTVYSESILFCKENLWNITEKTIPDKYSKIIFLDSDIILSDINWLNKSRDLFNNNDIIQPMSHVFKNLKDPNINTIDIDFDLDKPNFDDACYSVAYKILHNKRINLLYDHPGFAVGIDRNLYHKIHGFYDRAIIGGGDTLFWSNLSYIDIDYIIKNSYFYDEGYKIYQNNAKKHLSNAKVNCVENCFALHLYHGNSTNRNYRYRHKILQNMNTNISYNQYGILEVDKNTNEIIRQYLTQRNEDD